MTPSSTPSRRVSPKRTNRPFQASQPEQPSKAIQTIRIELRRSYIHNALIYLLSGVAILIALPAQLPLPAVGLIILWTIAALIHWRLNPQRTVQLVDEGDTWLLVSTNAATRVRYKHAEYCTTHLIVIAFVEPTGTVNRLFIWRDAVTQPAFSWLAARINLGQTDAMPKNMATSNPSAVFTFSSRPKH